jgi:DNA-binding MarR family transcriptional regulator
VFAPRQKHGAWGKKILVKTRCVVKADEATLLRLIELVSELATELTTLTRAPEVDPQHSSCLDNAAKAHEILAKANLLSESQTPTPFTRHQSPQLPDPRRIRGIIRQRQLRARFFDGELFSDPVWDILLDLAAARIEHKRVSITSACIASGVPPTTALRWIKVMVDCGLIRREDDIIDRRRSYLELTDSATLAMAKYFNAAELSYSTVV